MIYMKTTNILLMKKQKFIGLSVIIILLMVQPFRLKNGKISFKNDEIYIYF